MIVELIPYKEFKEKIHIVKEQLEKGRYVEVWDKHIFSIENRSENYEVERGRV